MRPSLTKLLAAFKGRVTYVIATVSLIIAAVGVLWGPGLLNRPSLVLSSVAMNLRIPAEFRRDFFFLRMMLESPRMGERIEESMGDMLKESGLTDDRIAVLLDPEQDQVEIKPHEEATLNAAIGRSISLMQSQMLSDLEVPGAVIFFEVTNSGRVAASNLRIRAALGGPPYDIQLDSDEPLLEKHVEGGEYHLSFARMAPGSAIRCTIWYSPGTREQVNEITLTHDHGTIKREVAEGSVVLGWRELETTQ